MRRLKMQPRPTDTEELNNRQADLVLEEADEHVEEEVTPMAEYTFMSLPACRAIRPVVRVSYKEIEKVIRQGLKNARKN